MTLADRTTTARRQCASTFAGRRCVGLEKHDGIHAAGDQRWRDPAWLDRARANGGLPAKDMTGRVSL